MLNTILQVPITKKLRDQAAYSAQKMGFSSLQEIVRVFLNQFASNEITIAFQSPTVKLSSKNDRRYTKMINNIATGRVTPKSFSNIDKMMDYLNK
ncbi:MAG: hypothetical protein Q7R77_03575 [Candidatus Daviesbacteria bacterium]|nr:hypothetical protein [Candidatus Daviesbacteria bacterium]